MPQAVTSLTSLWQDLLIEQVERSGLVSLVKSERRSSEVQDGTVTDKVYGQVHCLMGVSTGAQTKMHAGGWRRGEKREQEAESSQSVMIYHQEEKTDQQYVVLTAL